MSTLVGHLAQVNVLKINFDANGVIAFYSVLFIQLNPFWVIEQSIIKASGGSMKNLLCICTLCIATNSVAQELEEVVVTSHLLSDNGLAQSATVLSGEKLAEELQSSLGETVGRLPGVRSASFGGAVGRPVIHGLGGARIKTTEDRIDSLDVSVTSTDHAVTVEPFIANQINILKGSSTLLYGSGAIGGVVDVDTGRIPKELPEQNLSGRVELRAADNADAQTAAARLDGRLSDSVAWHVDAFSKNADDYEVAGEIESQALRDLEGEEHEEEESSELEGSRYDIEGGAIGLSFINETGFIGASISTLDATYGLVGGHGHEEEEGHHDEDEHEDEHDEEGEEGPGKIVLEQTRFDLEGQLNDPFSGVEKINVRLGINDYQHQEVEPNGEVGTFFDNEAWEGRIEVTHTPIAKFDGAFGLQLSGRDFSAIGEEAFVPPVESDTIGAFWVGEREFQSFSLEAGARIESVEHRPTQSNSGTLKFNSESASLGFIFPILENASLSALVDYTQRAPSVEELFSNGPHLATQTFEVGDASLTEESALGLSLGFHYHSDLLDLKASLYQTNFDGFIYQANTGEIEDELPVFNYLQDDADFVGLDFEAAIHFAEILGGDFDLVASFDTVSAELSGGENLPRIPADRQGLGLVWDNQVWRVKLDVSHVNKQDQLAALELLTDSYSDVSFKLTRRISIGDNTLSLFVNGRNLTDEEQREHVSFVKDVAPAAGRRVEAGLRFSF